jgi:hypothetical protein
MDDAAQLVAPRDKALLEMLEILIAQLGHRRSQKAFLRSGGYSDGKRIVAFPPEAILATIAS